MVISLEEQNLKGLNPRLRYIRFFKTRCEKCMSLVVHEPMWTFYTYDEMDGTRYNQYVCTSCISNLDDLIKYVEITRRVKI